MVSSRTDFRDRILAPLKVIADSLSLHVIYDDTAKQVPTDGTLTWVRVMVKHGNGSRASLGRADSKSKHTQSGFLFLEIYTPREDGLVDSDTISTAFADSLRNFADGEIWVSEVSEIEMGPDGNWFRSDVVASFEYDLIV